MAKIVYELEARIEGRDIVVTREIVSNGEPYRPGISEVDDVRHEAGLGIIRTALRHSGEYGPEDVQNSYSHK